MSDVGEFNKNTWLGLEGPFGSHDTCTPGKPVVGYQDQLGIQIYDKKEETH
jgi:hypothetical protein